MIHLIVALRLATAEDHAPPLTAADPIELREAAWVRYRVGPGERLADVAGRFGVSVDDLCEWNEIEPRRRRLRTGKRLRVLTRRAPPPRERITHVVERGETWQEIAIAHGIDTRKLRAYNWKQQRVRDGDELSLWVDPGQPQTVSVGAATELPAWDLAPVGGESVGRPQSGRVRHAVRLPESALYTRARPNWSWGSTHALQQLQSAIAGFRRDTGYSDQVVIGSISRRGGRSFPPHNSHQSGRDIDIRLPLRPGVTDGQKPYPDEVDWPAAWRLVETLVETGEVKVIFLERGLQRRLYEAARRAGESHERLADLLEWADTRRWSRAIVRHAKGHDGHIHVRFACGPDEKRCKG